MIPKIIYYTWVSPDPLPEKFNPYIETWKQKMPDYEIRQISLENIVQSPFVQECIKRGKYAIAGHYGRCERLYRTGGIYFDIDIEAVQSLDPLLDNEMVLGMEDETIINNAVIMAKMYHPFLKECLNYMDNFNLDEENPELKTGPWMFTKLFNDLERTIIVSDILILSPRYFYPYKYTEHFTNECVTSDTFTVHHWAKTWAK
jgi:mannosyltransferase OCH1-like enzyme